MGNAFGWPHLLVILVILLLLFGATKLPALAKSLGQSARAFKGEMNTMKEEDAKRASTPGETSETATSVASTDAPVVKPSDSSPS